jgi:phosphatidylglycerophosphate synthase
VGYSLEEVRVRAKREPFRAGVRMRYVMPRISVRLTRWILNHLPSVTPNQVTVVSAVAGLLVAGLLVVGQTWQVMVAAFLVYQLHLLLDYVDGELARVKGLESPVGGYFDLMVGRLTKPLILYGAVLGSWLSRAAPGDVPLDLLLGTLILLGFFLDKEAVDCWYRANQGRTDIEDRYEIASSRALTGAKRLVIRALIGLRGLQAFLVYQILAVLAEQSGITKISYLPGHSLPPRTMVLVLYAVVFPALALARSLYIARTGFVPRRQYLVRSRKGEAA